jgi:hypothetical protein
LDQLTKRPVLEHQRLTLVAVGALPERDEELVRLEQALTGFLTAQQNPDHRRILHRYLIWNLLRRLRSRNNGRRTTRQQVLRIRLRRRAAEAFLAWLDAHDLNLDTFGQPELEHWQGDPADCCTTPRSTPRTASPACSCSCSSTPIGHRPADHQPDHDLR